MWPCQAGIDRSLETAGLRGQNTRSAVLCSEGFKNKLWKSFVGRSDIESSMFFFWNLWQVFEYFENIWKLIIQIGVCLLKTFSKGNAGGRLETAFSEITCTASHTLKIFLRQTFGLRPQVCLQKIFWEPSDSSLRNSLRILGNLPKEYFYHTTLRLDPHFVPEGLICLDTFQGVFRSMRQNQGFPPEQWEQANLSTSGVVLIYFWFTPW